MSPCWLPVTLVIVSVVSTAALSVPVRCPDPGPASHRHLEDQDQMVIGVYSPGDYIFFSCDTGFSPDRHPEVTCQPDGTWDPLPQCLETHCDLPQITHGHVLQQSKLTWAKGEWVTFKCDLGYNISPYSSASLECVGSEDGTGIGWDRGLPTCKPVRCPPIVSSDIENGYVTTSGSGSEEGQYGVGDNVTVTCSDGYTLKGPRTRTCRVEGTWSGTLQTCDSGESLCGDPGQPIGGRKVQQHGTTYDLGDKVTFECSPGRTLIGSRVRVCLDNGHWSGQEVQCIGKNEFMGDEQIAEAYGNLVHHLAVETASSNETQENAAQYMGKQALVNGEDMEHVNKHGRSLTTLHKKGLDIFFAIDTSKSIPVEQRQFAVNVIKGIVRELGISQWQGTLVGLLAFNNTVWYRKVPQELLTIGAVDRALQDILGKATGGGTATAKAVSMIKDVLIPDARVARNPNPAPGARPKVVPRAVVLFTDGKSNMGGNPMHIVTEMKTGAVKTEFYCVGLGDAQVENLKMIATSETPEHLLITKGYSDSEIVQALLNNKIDFSTCGVADHRLHEQGFYAQHGAWPWMVGLYIHRFAGTKDKRAQYISGSNEFKCGGSLLEDGPKGSEWVLTAAHCLFSLYDQENNVMLKFGSLRSSKHNEQDETPVVIRAKDIYIHQNYSSSTLTHDIALIRLEEPVTYRKDIRPICLPRQGDKELYREDVRAVVTGWGKWNMTNGLPPRSPFLKQLSTKIFNDEDCNKKLQEKKIVPGMSFCAGGLKDHNDQEMDACDGDSGGPLVTRPRGQSTWTQIGVVSFGDKICRRDGSAGAYSMVSSYIDWVQARIAGTAQT